MEASRRVLAAVRGSRAGLSRGARERLGYGGALNLAALPLTGPTLLPIRLPSPSSALPSLLLLIIRTLLQELSPLLSASCRAFPNHQHHHQQHCSHHHPPQQSSPLPHPLPPSSTSAVPPTASPPPAFSPAPNPSSPYTPHAPAHLLPLCDAAVAAAAGDVGVVEMGGACYLVRVTALHCLAAQAERGTHTGALGARPLSPLPVRLPPVHDEGKAPSVAACTALGGLLPVLPHMPPLLLACRNASLQEVPPADAQATLTHLLSFVLNLLAPPIALATTPTHPSHQPPLQQQQGAWETAAAAAAEEGRGGNERVGEPGGGERADDDGFVRVGKPRRKARRWQQQQHQQQQQQQQQQQEQERLHGDNGCCSRTGGVGEDGECRGSNCGVGRATGGGRGAVVVMQGDAALRACHVALPTVNGWLLGYPVVYLLPALHSSPQPFPSEQPAVPPGEAMARCLAATPLSVLSVSAACSAGEKGIEGSRPHDSQQHGSLLPTNTHTHELLRFSVPSFLLSAPDSPPPHLHHPWLHSLLTALQSRVASCPSARDGAPNEVVESEDGRRDSGGSGGSEGNTLGVPNGSVGGAAAAAAASCSVQEERMTTSCCTGAIVCQAWHEKQQEARAGKRHSSAWWCWEQLRVAVNPAETSAVVL
ncbi:unnamed protein product [Closterium sp. NIES-65]|nr:unnamed protein product [Closterium sp. NIES-65]